MSSLIIRNHLKHTLEMLREHAVPQPVIEIATQHHGTTLMEFFYHKAKKELEDQEEVHEEDYRYPGPKPQTREAGVLMLADGVEAAARSLAEPTEDRLRSVVQRVINAKFTDGQLDHCDLTLRDLHLIAKAFLVVLRGIYHQRPTYPWQQREREAARERDQTQRRRIVDDLPEHAEKDREKDREKDKAPPAKAADAKRHEKPDAKHEARRERDVTGPKTAIKAKKSEPAPKRGGKHGDERPEEVVHREPESGGAGAAPAEPESPDDAPAESSPDIKRLGLN
jgi:hypothetical protein